MSELKIGEAGSVQFPMVDHAVEVGWTPLKPADALYRRGGEAGGFLRGELTHKLRAFNPWLNDEGVRGVIDALEALPPTIEGNRQLLAWLHRHLVST